VIEARQKVDRRERISQIFAKRCVHRVGLVCAPTGSGATTALLGYCRAHGATYVSIKPGMKLRRFIGELVEALAKPVPGLQMTFVAAYERALQTDDTPQALANWFSQHSSLLPSAIVVDELHEAGDPDVARFLVRAVEATPGARWLFASQTLCDLPVAIWLANGTASLPIESPDLMLEPHEALELAAEIAPEVDAGHALALLAATAGNIAAFSFFLRRGHWNTAGDLDVPSALARTFASLSRRERDVALRVALLPVPSEHIVAELKVRGALALLTGLRLRQPEFFEADRFRFNRFFLEFAKGHVRSLGVARCTAIFNRAARALEANGESAAALELYSAIELDREIRRLIDTHGLDELEGGCGSRWHEAVESLSATPGPESAVVLAFSAVSAALHGRTDVSESLFAHAISACTTDERKSRIRYLYALDLLRRDRPDAYDLLKPDRTFFSAPARVRALATAALAVSLVQRGRLKDAKKWIQRALTAAKHLSDAYVSARVNQQASYVSVWTGDIEAARHHANSALALAERIGAFETASAASSVLYEIAADADEDRKSARTYIELTGSYAAKVGNVDWQLFALIGAYEIEAERGDVAALAEIGGKLSLFDLQYGTRASSEALLPALVLQQAWRGDFTRAFSTLAASTEELRDPGRQALRYAELACYAVAARNEESASEMLVLALRKLRLAPPATLRTARTRLYCALAFTLLGRQSGAKRLLCAADQELSARFTGMRALARVVEQVVNLRAGGHGEHTALVEALEALRTQDLGGLAKLVEALPGHFFRADGAASRPSAVASGYA